MLFKDQLKSAMKEQGIKYNNQAARIIDVSPQRLGLYLSGQSTPGYNDAVEMLKCLNWDVIAFPQKK